MPHPLNPEAGSSPVPTDPRETKAAMHAGALSLWVTPYYGFRFGERGRRFTWSDSAFLATLADHTSESMERQVVWLSGVLANRGMPSILLESHLRVISRVLSRACPEKKENYQKLLEGAKLLREKRRVHMSDEELEALARAFPEFAGLPPNYLSIGTGRLIACAVADERAGVRNAVKSILAWFANPEFFPPRFIKAVEKTIANARAAASTNGR